MGHDWSHCSLPIPSYRRALVDPGVRSYLTPFVPVVCVGPFARVVPCASFILFLSLLCGCFSFIFSSVFDCVAVGYHPYCCFRFLVLIVCSYFRLCESTERAPLAARGHDGVYLI